MRDQDGTASRAAIEAANRRIQAAIDALPDYASPEFWLALAAQGTALPTEVLVHVVRALRVRGRAAEAEQEQLLGRLTYERALASLEPGLREIARLMAEGELTQRQIAARVGCTEKTVYNRLARIRDHLAGFFYGEVHDDH